MTALRVIVWSFATVVFLAVGTITQQAILIWWGDLSAQEAFVRAWWSVSGLTLGFYVGKFLT